MKDWSFWKDSFSVITSTSKRFPATIALVLIVMVCIMIGFQKEHWSPEILSIMISGTCGVILSMNLHVAKERYTQPRAINSALWFAFLVYLVLSYLYWKNIIESDQFVICSAVTYSGSLVIFTLMLSLVPYFKTREKSQELLTYNRTVFSAYIFSAILSFILYSGLSLAILAVDNLFDVNIPGKTYAHLVTLIGGLVWTFLFLSSFPADYEDNRTKTNPGYSIIVQYIGVPVIVVYALILLFYAIKNVIWPDAQEEWTLWLILWFYILSFLIFCLNDSIKNDREYRWSRWFSRWYLIGSIPITILTLISSWKTIRLYGVTELTYFIAAFSLFLLIISLYLIFSAKKEFRFVPLLLLLFVIVSVWGPLNMCISSVRSQTGKLKLQLEENRLLVNNTLTPAAELNQQSREQIVGRLEFLHHRNKLNVLKQWDAGEMLGDDPLVFGEVLMALNLDTQNGRLVDNTYIQGEKNREIDISGYSRLIPIVSPFFEEEISGLHITFSREKPSIYLYDSNKILSEFDYSSVVDPESLRKDKYILVENENYSIKMYFVFLELDFRNHIVNIDGLALYQNLTE